MQTTFETVRRLVQQVVDVEDMSITLESTPEQMHLNSLDIAELIMAVEEEFDILIEDEEAVHTLGDLVTAVKVQQPAVA